MSKPVIPWIGGKRRLAKHIIPVMPEHQCYCEPFAGGAALFFLKPPAKAEVLNDINGDVINLYRVLAHHLEEFVRQFRWALVSRQMFEWAQMSEPETLTDIQRAGRFYYLQRLTFGGKVEGQTFGTSTTGGARLNLLRIEEDLSAAHIRLARAVIEHLDWLECIKRYDRPHTLFFCDPPYFKTEGYGVPFGLEQYRLMAAAAKAAQGKMIITVNDIPEMRDIFDGLSMRRLEIAYTVAGSDKRKQAGELLITNW